MTYRILTRLLLAAIAGHFAADADAAVPVEIAAIAPLSGSSASIGSSMTAGIALAAKQINGAGGVLGRPLALIECDEGTALGTGGERLGRELTVEHPVTAAVGIVSTRIATGIAPYFEDRRIPLVVSAATGSKLSTLFGPPEYRENYIFHLAQTTRIEATKLAGYARQRSFRKIAALAGLSRYGESDRTDLLVAFPHLGMPLAAVEKFNIGDITMKEQLARARSTGADALLAYGGGGAEMAQIARDRLSLDWPAPLMGSWIMSSAAFIDPAGRAGEGSVMSATFFDVGETPAQAAFIDALHAMTGTDRIAAPSAAAQGYDALLVLAAAITQAGSTDGAEIRTALEHLARPVAGMVKTYDHPFSPDDHDAIGLADISLGMVKNGRAVRLPETASPGNP